MAGGSNVGGYHKRQSKRKAIVKLLRETLHLEQPASETYRQSCKEVSIVIRGLF